jgi:hypothetical protein
VAAHLQLQTNNKTFLGRYWTEHTVLRRYVASDRDLSILSFGCSTGEELATMRALFPAARLSGCDIDWQNLQAARALIGNAAMVFESRDDEVARHGPYDVILCNSVLMQPTIEDGGRRRAIDPSLWSDVVALLDSALRPGGILQIINSNIPFRYHPLARQYQPLRTPLILGPNFVDQFDLDGRHLCSGVAGAGWSAMLTRHLGEESWRELHADDLRDVHFRKASGTARRLTGPEDEIVPTAPHGDSWASGTMTYRPHLTPDHRPSTHTEVDVVWKAFGVDSVRVSRTARRLWFDGSVLPLGDTVSDLVGPSATAFIEASTGRRSSRLSMDALLSPQAIRSPSF